VIDKLREEVSVRDSRFQQSQALLDVAVEEKEKLSQLSVDQKEEIRILKTETEKQLTNVENYQKLLSDEQKDAAKYISSLAQQKARNIMLEEKVKNRYAEILVLQEKLVAIEEDRNRLREEREEIKTSLQAARSEVKQMKALLSSSKGEKTALRDQVTTLKDQVNSLNKLVNEMRSSRARSRASSSRRPARGAVTSRHVVISNLDARVNTSAIRNRLSKWNIEFVDVKYDDNVQWISTSNVVLCNSDEARAVIERLDGVDWKENSGNVV